MYRTTFYTFNDFDEAFEILSAQKRQKASDYIGCLLLSQSPMVIDLTCLIAKICKFHSLIFY